MLATLSPLKLITLLFVLLRLSGTVVAQNAGGKQPMRLEDRLRRESSAKLTADVQRYGSATRGAILFHQPVLACTKCHSVGETLSPLGPDLARWDKPTTIAHLVESVLTPSKAIRKGYEAVTVVNTAGKTLTGLVKTDDQDTLVLKDPSRGGKLISVPKKEIELRKKAGSIMPLGLANQLANRQQFLDLVKYLAEVSKGGPKRAEQLRPPAALFALPPVPAYEKNIDHAGLISSWDTKSFARGKEIYNRLCINCHGTKDRAGSLPTSLRFATGRFKSGCDPYSMYQTLTYGFGMMIPQAWMVPQQKYDVIYYVRQAYLKPYNSSQYSIVDNDYLKRLPKGTTRGPKPSKYAPWENMNYGPSLIASYEAGRDGTNIAYKAIAVRLDAGPGGVSRGKHWMAFEHDTLRVSAAWSGKQFIDYNGIMFNGRHNIHPRIPGDIHWSNPTAPGWANPETGSFDDPRIRGRDGKPYGPLPRQWAHYKGLYHYGNQTIISYSVGKTAVLEMPGIELRQSTPVFTRSFYIGPRSRKMTLQVARLAGGSRLTALQNQTSSRFIIFGNSKTKPTSGTKAKTQSKGNKPLRFDGTTYLAVMKPQDFDLTGHDFTIAARIRTRRGGTIFAKTATGEKWARDCKALFIRGGRLVYDIGWVGAVTSRRRVNDGKWHDVAMTWEKSTGSVRLYLDGKLDRTGQLAPKKLVRKHEVRIGFAAPDFPRSRSYFNGRMGGVRFFDRKLTAAEIGTLKSEKATPPKGVVASWNLTKAKGDIIADADGRRRVAVVRRGKPKFGSNGRTMDGVLVAGLTGTAMRVGWSTTKEGDLRMVIPSGETPLRFTLAVARVATSAAAKKLSTKLGKRTSSIDLTEFTKGGPPRWPQKLVTKRTVMKKGGAYEVDVFTRPVANPWFCRVRFTGLDFLPDGRRMAACTWDGDVWMIDGIGNSDGKLTWQRIASGLFQPLGLKYHRGKIYLACRDQITILHDLNGDGETDFYENFNSDHQVTEHFHEFAMGLQTDSAGNFYYAKSARHALPALVPHHGTLLKVSSDGSKTEIVANGFRAANGVCLNPDGTFYVTDQEGHWNPKNRINRVKKGGFYGNMFGYHNVKSSADDAMEQPLCWITNAFDRSPAELLWVDSRKWGPLNNALLNLSYGYGKVFVVLRQKVGKQMQGGMCELPLPNIPTGLIRGRFHPNDGQLYACGMFAWAGSRQQPGGLYRIRYTGRPVNLPIGLEAKPGRLVLTFTDALDPTAAKVAAGYAIKIWSLKRTKNYGSKHYNTRSLKVASVVVRKDGKTVELQVPKLKPTWCMEIKFTIRAKDSSPVRGVIHNTIHKLAE